VFHVKKKKKKQQIRVLLLKEKKVIKKKKTNFYFYFSRSYSDPLALWRTIWPSAVCHQRSGSNLLFPKRFGRAE
jgi:hypothetical protein